MTKIEEVARIIDPWAFSSPRGPGNALARERAMDKARAAIEALRQPTPEMYHAAVMTHVYENGGIEHSPGLSWKAMIDAILKEEGNG